MGNSCTKIGRHHHHHHHNHHHQQQQQSQQQQPPQPSIPTSPIPPHTLPPITSPPPPLPQPRLHRLISEPHIGNIQFYPNNPINNLPPNSGRSHNPNRGNGRSGSVAPCEDNSSVKKIKNDVNVHRDSVKVELDEKCLDSYLVSFTFDALVDGSVTIFYFAKEGANCTITPVCPEMCMPWRFPFQKGLGQKFCQPSGTGINLGFFEVQDLLKPSPIEDVFPLVISAETSLPFLPLAEELHQPYLPTAFSHSQITQAVIEKKNEGNFQVKVVNQILWVDGVRYELHEIYGISNGAGFTDNELEEECIICMSEPKTTAILPCRHLCLCSECAKELRVQSNKCPVCRQPIEEVLKILVNKESS